jgi:hypothetical protein
MTTPTITWADMERHGIDTNRVRDTRASWVGPQSWVLESADEQTKLHVNTYDGDAAGIWQTLVCVRTVQGHVVSYEQDSSVVPRYWTDADRMLDYVSEWQAQNQ